MKHAPVFAFFLLAGAAAAQPEWRVGLAQTKITPSAPVPLAGYDTRTEPFTSVDLDLTAKALALVDRDGNRALLVTAEFLGFPAGLAERVCRRIGEQTGVPRKSILLNGSHTHAAPVVAPEMGWPPPGPSAKPVAEYIAQVEDKLVLIARQSLADAKPARLAWGTGIAQFVVNRRQPSEKGIILGVNPRGIADRTVPVLRVEGAGGELRGIVFGAAAHAVTAGGKNLAVTGDYPGYAMAAVEQAFPGAQAMFVAGCAGDAAPFPRGSLEFARMHGKNLAAEVGRVLKEEMQPVQGPLRTEFRQVDLPLRRFTPEQVKSMGENAPNWRRFFTDRALEIFKQGGELPRTYPAPFAVWQFGGSLTLVAFSGETVVDYATMAEQRLGPLNLWVAGYSNDLFGYLPSARLLSEGGYETRGLYMGVGLFDPSVETTVMNAVSDMARAAGRRTR